MRTSHLLPLLAAVVLLLLTAMPAPAQVQPLSAWWIDTGDTDSTGLGTGMAPLGDINGDGYDDFVVGATLGYYAGNLYVYLGGSQPDTVPAMVIPRPDSLLQWFGLPTFSVGDVNGDRFPDFIAQGTRRDTPPVQEYAYLYFGGPLLDTIPALTFKNESEQYSNNFGFSGAGLGDVNGDGYDDFAITDGWYDSGNPNGAGAIYIYYGGPELDSIPDLTIHGNISVVGLIGYLVAPLGDVNSDGYADWVMSHPLCYGPQGEHYAGVVAIYYGGNPPDTTPHTVIYGPAADAWLGKALTTLDWNGDGQVDIFAGSAIQYPPNYYSSIWEFNVSTTMTGQPNHIFLGRGGTFSCIGNFMFNADLNGDGRQDLIDGELGVNICGEVYVFLNGTGQDTLFDATYYQGNFDASLGHRGCNVGDFNGDGIEDIAIGEGYEGYGRIHLILGNDSLHQSGVSPLPEPPLPQTTALLNAYPNPFNSEVVLEITAPSLKDNRIQIYNLKGEEIRRFQLSTGQSREVWDGTSASGQLCASGVYIAKLTGPSYQTTTKLTLIR